LSKDGSLKSNSITGFIGGKKSFISLDDYRIEKRDLLKSQQMMNDLDPMMVGRHVNNLVNNLTPGKTPHKSSFNDMNFDFIEEDPLEYEHKQQDNSTSQNNGKKSNTNG
jgi:hypothetical protein